MKKSRLTITCHPTLTAAVDKAAKARGITRSKLVADILSKHAIVKQFGKIVTYVPGQHGGKRRGAGRKPKE